MNHTDTPDPLDALRREAAALRAETAELEAALTTAERAAERFERIVEVVPGIVWESDGSLEQPDYHITYVGGQVERILGYPREQWTRDPTFWLSLLHPDDRPAVLAHATREGRSPEHRFLARDGREVWVAPHVRHLRDEAGASLGTSIFVMDVTERVAAARAGKETLERTEALTRKLDELVASVPGIVWESRGGPAAALQVPVFFSSHLTTVTGYLPHEAEGVQAIWQLLSHPDDWHRAARELERCLAEGTGTFEHRWLTKDGDTLWVESHVRALHDDHGELVGACGVTMDITARKRSEDERETLEDQVIGAQADALAELSTPLIPISARILVMPLIGTIDAQRAAHVIEVLLHGIARARARVAILDVTGVPTIDIQTADALVRAARSVRLLGARAILTGIRPEVARTLVTLGVDLDGITTASTLESGIAHAAGRPAIAPANRT